MKNLMLPLFAILLFAACQNTSTTTEKQNPDTQTEFKIDPVQLKAANTKSKAVLQNINNLMAEVKAAAPTLTEAQQTEVDGIRSQLDDLMEKQETMTKALETADNAGGTPTGDNAPTPGVIQDFIESTSNYDKLIEDLRAQLEAIKSGKAKGQ